MVVKPIDVSSSLFWVGARCRLVL